MTENELDLYFKQWWGDLTYHEKMEVFQEILGDSVVEEYLWQAAYNNEYAVDWISQQDDVLFHAREYFKGLNS